MAARYGWNALNVRIVLCLLASVLCAGCTRTVGPKIAPIPTLTVEELLASPRNYSHKLIKVRGCFVSGFEKTVLQPCQSKIHSDQIWVDNALIYHELSLPRIPEATPDELKNPELKHPADGKLLFQYDEKRDSRAWDKLGSLDQTAPQVLLLGQFETISSQVPVTMESGFGHLNAYVHELILVDVLDIETGSTK
jgi:hypothetical protein